MNHCNKLWMGGWALHTNKFKSLFTVRYRLKVRFYVGKKRSKTVVNFCGEMTVMAILCIYKIKFNYFLICCAQTKITLFNPFVLNAVFL